MISILEVHFENHLIFAFHIKKIRKSGNRKIHSLATVVPYVDLLMCES